MTFFRTRITSKLWRFREGNPEIVIAFGLFALLMIHGSSIGLTDDEAYYWVLAQKPALGYAYHPPAVAWFIALSQRLTGWILGTSSSAMVRLPAALCISASLAMALRWVRKAGVRADRIGWAGLILLSFAGLSSLSWMMVPDLPLILGWTMAFFATWGILFGRRRGLHWATLVFGICLCLLSKYSGVLTSLSCALAFWLWSENPADTRRGWIAIAAGGALALVPILIWNANHEWASILYQIRDRHEGGSFSLTRFARFWGIEALAAGPVLLAFVFGSIPMALKMGRDRPELSYCWLWAAPAALVFGLQPLWSDFKPHWAFIAWWPLALALAWTACTERGWARAVKYQVGYGLGLAALVLVSCHFPLGNWMLNAVAGDRADPRLDVTNDLYGWRELPAFLRAQPENRDLSTAVVGSRYQTAAQAYFALGLRARVTMLPRDVKARDEWPDLAVGDGEGPAWPKLKEPVFFVADNRYDAPPAFRDSTCLKIGRVGESRGGFPAKWIDVWRCEPGASRP